MIATAIPAGFAAGLFGIGGGLVTVPILFYIFSFSGIETAYVMHLAVGTSFGIIIPTSTVSVLTHHQHKAVDFNIVKGFGFFVATGVILGTIFAASLETKPLILFFTIVVYVLAFYLLFIKEKETNIEIKIGLFSKAISGIVRGFISAPMGIGGAVMNVPILKFFGYPINKAIGSAAAIGFIIALFITDFAKKRIRGPHGFLGPHRAHGAPSGQCSPAGSFCSRKKYPKIRNVNCGGQN